MKQSAKTIDNYSPVTVQETPQDQAMTKLIDKYGNKVKHSINSSEMIDTVNTPLKEPWKKGISGNPNGRPPGSRNALSEAFIKDVHQQWLDHGMQALDIMLLKAPDKFCQLVAQIIPKDFQVSVDDGSNVRWVISAQPAMSTDQWLEHHNLQPVDNQDNTDN